MLVDGHNLTWLCRQAKKYDKGFHQWFDESADLNQCYVETRYPADIEREYTYKMVKNFYRMAKEMYQYIFADDAAPNSRQAEPAPNSRIG